MPKHRLRAPGPRYRQRLFHPSSLLCARALVLQHQLPGAPQTLVAAATPPALPAPRTNSRRRPGGQQRPSASSQPGGCLGCTGHGAGARLRGCLGPPWPGQPSQAQGAAPARPREDNPLLSWCIPAGSSAHTSAGRALPLFRAWGLARCCKFPPLGSTATDYFPNHPCFTAPSALPGTVLPRGHRLPTPL